MTNKEKKIALIKALGLEIGDSIRFMRDKYLIYEKSDDIVLKLSSSSHELDVYHLIKWDWIKLEKPIRYGNVKCEDMKCSSCPLAILDCGCNDIEKTLYEILDNSFNKHNTSKYPNIYRAFKEELDKEVENE